MLYNIDKYKLMRIFIILVITTLLVTIVVGIIEQEAEKQKQEIIATRDTRLESRIYAEDISKGYLKIINIAGETSLIAFKDDYRGKMEPAIYTETFGGLGVEGYNKLYKKYTITDIKSTQTQVGGTITVKVHMEVEIDKRNLVYKTEVVNGRIRSIKVVGTKTKLK